MTGPRTVLVDLRASQFDGDRGIPAYLQSLTAHLVRRSEGCRWLLLHDARRPLPSRAAELADGAAWRTEAELERDRSLHIDALLTGCFFLPDHRCGPESLWPAWLARHQPRRLGIVYDLVPLLFPDRYLAKPRARRHYLDSLRLLRRSDRLFAISHATRRDTIRHAAVDPARIECIYGDIDHHKRALMREPAERSAGLPARVGLRGPYCVCIGGGDWRKNMPTAIQAFAEFHATHPDHQLAVVCKLGAERVGELERLATSLGLPAGAIVYTGYVSDEDLVGLVSHARLLFYPSLYEGLGLPVLEAYGCGTPAVGSATSSVAELLLPELACDPTDPAALAGAMRRLTGDATLRERSLAFGHRLLAETLGWDRAADRVLAALQPVRRPVLATAPPRVAVAGVLPPARTGIAGFTARFLKSGRWQTTFFEAGPGPRLPTATLSATCPVRPIESLAASLLRGRHETAIFVLGNSPHHAKVLDALMQTRGTTARRLAYLHEAALESLFRAWLGPEADQLPAPSRPAKAAPWIERAIQAKPNLGRALLFLAKHAELDGLIVNSAACRDLIRTLLGSHADRWKIDVAFLPIEAATAVKLPRAGGPLRIGSFGLAGDTKRIDLVSQALALLRPRRPVELVIAGWEAGRYCRRTGLDRRGDVTVLDSPDEAALTTAMRSVDVAVQLRAPTFGESSAVVAQLLGLGTPVVVTAEGSFAELPASLVSGVPADCTPIALAAAIEAAADHPATPDERASLLTPWSPTAYADRLAELLTVGRPGSQPQSRSA
jgi:glycosyltransferase involved in cell wall biosynthesis